MKDDSLVEVKLPDGGKTQVRLEDLLQGVALQMLAEKVSKVTARVGYDMIVTTDVHRGSLGSIADLDGDD